MAAQGIRLLRAALLAPLSTSLQLMTSPSTSLQLVTGEFRAFLGVTWGPCLLFSPLPAAPRGHSPHQSLFPVIT